MVRDELDSILDFIDSPSMTDDEWAAVSVTDNSTDLQRYAALLAVLDSRNAVDATRQRLQWYYLAMGVQFPELPPNASSNIYIGDDLS